MSGNFDYQTCYDTVYAAGYHSDLNYSHAKELCDLIEEKYEFDSILDIGCSHGWVLRRFKSKRAVGIDASSIAVEKCRELGLEAHCIYANHLVCYYEIERLNDANNFSFTPVFFPRFDVVVSTDCFEHIHPSDIAISIQGAVWMAKKVIAMKIATKVDQAHWKNHVGHDLHLTVRPLCEWIDDFKQECFRQGRTILSSYTDYNKDTFILHIE